MSYKQLVKALKNRHVVSGIIKLDDFNENLIRKLKQDLHFFEGYEAENLSNRYVQFIFRDGEEAWDFYEALNKEIFEKLNEPRVESTLELSVQSGPKDISRRVNLMQNLKQKK